MFKIWRRLVSPGRVRYLSGQNRVSKTWRRSLVLATAILFACFLFNGVAVAGPAFPGWPLLDEVRYLMESNFVNPAGADNLEEGAVRGMVESLGDPYSEYIPPGQVARFATSLGDEYIGVGIIFEDVEGQVVISGVIPGSPAARLGVRVGSVMTAVNGRSVKGLSLEEIAQLLLGEEVGTYVDLTVTLPGSGVRKSYYLRREQVRPPLIESRLLTGQIGYLGLRSFPKWAPEEVAKALKSLEAQGCRGLILDLRNNPGGYFEAASEIASLFLIKDKPVVRVVDRDQKVTVINSRGPGQDLPLVVLVDRGTASAAEILAGALQANQAALLLGETTYGKGALQTVFPLSNGGALKLTTAYYYTPAGQAIQGAGLEPDIEVSGEWEQLERAQRILREQFSPPVLGSKGVMAVDAEPSGCTRAS